MKTEIVVDCLILGTFVMFLIWLCFVEGPRHPWPPMTDEGSSMIYIAPTF
jgi:hypothetical protein